MKLAEGRAPKDPEEGESASVAATGGPQTEAVVDLDAIAHNVRVLREFAGDAALMAVIKADGYNHGAVAVARTALSAGARELGVTTIGEALVLRAAGITAPVLAWLHGVDADFAAAISADVEIGVSSPRHLAAVVTAARDLGRTATVTLKVDTGLNRNGVSQTDWPQMLEDLVAARNEGTIRLRGVFSHLAHSDEPHHDVIDHQKQRLIDAVADVRAQGFEPEVVHLSNSAATVTRPDLRFDMVRPGIAIYGLSPVPEMGDFGLRPAMTLRAKVILVKKVAAGEGVSYGHLWTAPRDTTLALLPVGYADGLPRSLSGRFEVQLGGKRRQAVGRICMDQVMVDLGPDGDGVREGDTAIFFGNGDQGEPNAQAWAEVLDTIHYEIVTGLRGRTERTYIGGEGIS
ncbi:alanine racemase [Rhodococcus sp. IEGM 1366]|uniref:alanine racemase n=1 Tax=Rhodococcus sp. IEGM 1366 TaxID=3082223 RepID=UPI002953B371|nr:alanine racemase [Rhodococcus sp. IEGM 1366]MDV8071237.1 alanine racemase [Rhodococcus sp. IEGM 1366]